jgi:hypothetical protein
VWDRELSRLAGESVLQTGISTTNDDDDDDDNNNNNNNKKE